MGFLKSAVAGASLSKAFNPDAELGHHMRPYQGGYLSSGLATMEHFNNDFENAYSSIRVIANGFAKTEPFTIDKTGKSVSSNILDRLYTPNTAMSAYDFREALIVMSLIHDKVYIRPHHTGVRLNANSLTGFTFLEAVSEHIVDGKMQYWLANGEQLMDDQIIVLRSINPYNLSGGFSPAHAARRWTRLDDLIADYQVGFFNNGTVPAGQFTITAKTKADYEDMAANIRAFHRGAGKNNNVMFAHRPVDATGKPVDSQIEWTPFNTSNKDLALKDIFEQANHKIDSTYGVPASLRGVNDNNTYASVRVDQQIFIENTLEPLTLKVWQKFNHELNRICGGGTGVAISFKIDPPVVADEEKVKAESRKVEAETVVALTTAGYELKSVVSYIKSGNANDLVQLPPKDEKPEVLDSSEARSTPEQPVDPAHISSKAFDPSTRAKYEARLGGVVRSALERQVQAAAGLVSSKAVSPESPVDEAENERLYAEMSAVLLAALNAQGGIEHQANIDLLFEAGIRTDKVSPFILTSNQRAAYESLLEKVARDINATTATKIRTVLDQGRASGQSAAEIKQGLDALVEEWRVRQIAVTEVNAAGNSASVYSMQSIAAETGAKVLKKYEHNGSDTPCSLCQSFIAMAPVDVTENFVELDATISLVDGTSFKNAFAPMDGTRDPHPSGHCRQVYEVVA